MTITKISNILRRDGLLFTTKRALAYLIGQTPWWHTISFSYYKNYRLVFAPSMLTYVLFAGHKARDEDTQVIQKFVKPGDIVVDIGAHIGSTVIVAADQAGSSGKVLAFEASPKFFSFLKQNIDKNNLNDIVTCYPYAIGDRKTQVNINESVTDDTTNHIGKSGNAVEQVTLDDYTKDFAKVSFIKIDVEGYEPKVLEGAVETLKKTDCIYIEFCTSNLKNLGFTATDITDSLKPHFSLYTHQENTLVPFAFIPGKPYAVNLVALKQQ